MAAPHEAHWVDRALVFRQAALSDSSALVRDGLQVPNLPESDAPLWVKFLQGTSEPSSCHRDHFLENATARIASLRGLITSIPER